MISIFRYPRTQGNGVVVWSRCVHKRKRRLGWKLGM